MMSVWIYRSSKKKKKMVRRGRIKMYFGDTRLSNICDQDREGHREDDFQSFLQVVSSGGAVPLWSPLGHLSNDSLQGTVFRDALWHDFLRPAVAQLFPFEQQALENSGDCIFPP